ncbi:hypothetical protein MMC19_000144 [Ptychographa xylographoides]|nr:hypothetical protein [Ptychographa xylographoides]
MGIVLGLPTGAGFSLAPSSCITARRRRKQGVQPYRFTGWAGGNHGTPQYNPNYNEQSNYNPPVQPYGNNQYNATPSPMVNPPNYTPPKEGNYYGNGAGGNQGYFGGQSNGIELQQPNNTYQPARGGDNGYSAPEGPPPPRGDGIIR